MVICALSSADWAASVTAKLFDLEESGEGVLSNAMIEEIVEASADQADCQRLASELLRSGTMTYTPEMRMFDCFEMLAGADSDCNFVSSTTVLEVFTEFTEFEKTRCLSQVLLLIQRHRPRMGCSFIQFKECEELACAVVNLFKWFVAALDALKELESCSDTCNAIMATIKTAQQYIADPFIFRVLKLVGRSKNIAGGPDSLRAEVADPLEQWKNTSILFFRELGELHAEFIRIFEPLDPMELDYMCALVQKLRRPGIRSLTSVLISFRVLMPVKEVAETIMVFSKIHGYSSGVLLLDFLHASLLIMLEEQEKHEGKGHSVLFFFAKLPKILEYFLERKFVTRDIIQNSLTSIVEKFRHELDLVDHGLKENSVKTLTSQLCEANVIKDDYAQQLQIMRLDQIKSNIDLHQHIITHQDSNDKQVTMLLSTKMLKAALEKCLDSDDKLGMMLERIVASGVTLFDSCCSSFCVNGDLPNLTRRIATMSLNAEKRRDPNRLRQDLKVFTINFALLARVSFNYPSLSVEQLVAGKNGVDRKNVETSFYKWTHKMVKKIVPMKTPPETAKPESSEKTQMETDAANESETSGGISEDLRLRYLNLAHGEIFWDITSMSLYEILETVPSIGTVWLEEFNNTAKSPEKSKAAFRGVIYSFSELPVMMLCLAQWLESEPQSQQRHIMSRSILEVLDDFVDPNGTFDKNIWSFVRSVVRLHLEEVHATAPPSHPVSIYLKSIANRTLPQCLRLQIPDLNILKDGWIYAQRQNWFNQPTLVLIDHMNRAKQHRSWIKLLVNNMMKLDTQDHMGKAIELICATLLLDPVRSIIVALEILFDFMLSRDGSTDPAKPGLQHQSEFVIPLVKLIVQILLMGIWIVDTYESQKEEPPEKRARMGNGGPFGELEEADRVETLLETMKNCVNCMLKESMNAVYSPSTSIVFHILNMMARSSPNRCKTILMQMIPHELLFRLGMLDPRMIPLEMFNQFCDPASVEHDQAQLQFLCLLRRSGGL